MIEDILATALILGGGTLFLLSISPIGKAIAEGVDFMERLPAESREAQRFALLR